MSFNPKEHLTNLRGKEYLETKWRIAWFRDEHAKGQIVTELVNIEPLIMKATVIADDGGVLATGYGSAQAKAGAVWAGREIEKAETAAIGRALGHAGYGTQFTDEDEDEHLADSPVDKKSNGGTSRPTPPPPPATGVPTPQNPTPSANGTHEQPEPTSKNSPALLLLNDLINSPDLKQRIEQENHRRATVNLLAKHGLFANCETTPDMLAIVQMYIDERAKGTDKEKTSDKAVDAVKRTLGQFASLDFTA